MPMLLKTSKIGPSWLSKVVLCCRLSLENGSLETDFITGKLGPGQFSKAVGSALRNLFFNRSKGFELTGFEKL